MKAIVDEEGCIGCEACVGICPEVFEMKGDVAVTTVNEVPEDVADSCREAAASCPVDAIAIEE